MDTDGSWIGKVYDAEGHVTETLDFGASKRAKCRAGVGPGRRDNRAEQQAKAMLATKPSELFFTKTLEFRLWGTDVQERLIPLPAMESEYRTVASANLVHTFVL